MKRFFLLPFFFNAFISLSQQDKFNFNFDLTLGSVSYYYDEIENGNYYFSSEAWYDTVHYLDYKHEFYRYSGLNALIHAGLHIPILKNKTFSFGVCPKAGIGRLIQLMPLPNSLEDNYGNEVDNDPKRISSASLDVELYGYLRYNLYTNHLLYANASLYGGYRYMYSHDDYSTPVVGIEYGQEKWSIACYAHLCRMNYYRQFSDGSLEVAKSFREIGLTVNLYLPRKIPEKKEEIDAEEE